jgi:hypothetical protein
MTRLNIPLLFCLAVLASATGAAAGTVEERGNTVSLNGVYSVSFNLNILSAMPAGTLITCRVQIAPNQEGLDPRNRQLAAVPASAAGRVVLTGSTATCTAEIPFAWTVESARGGVVLRYEIEAVSGSGTAPLLVRSSEQQNIGAAFPTSGGSASLRLNVGL